METSTLSFAFTGVVPALCDAEAGESGFPAWRIRPAMAEDNERDTAGSGTPSVARRLSGSRLPIAERARRILDQAGDRFRA
jgi:hypothetical protein